MLIYKLREDSLTSEDNTSYTAYGIDICHDGEMIESIKDITLNKNELGDLLKKHKNSSILSLINAIHKLIDR